MKCVALFALLVSGASALNVKYKPVKPQNYTPHDQSNRHPANWASIQRKRAKNVKALKNAKEQQSIIFYGDSIVERLSGEKDGHWTVGEGGKKELWMEMGDRYGPALASGIGGDQIKDLHYRLQNGESPAAAKPKAIILHIGMNDVHDLLEEREWEDLHHADMAKMAKKVFADYKNIVEELNQASPNSAMVLTAILPHGRWWPTYRFAETAGQLNKLIASLADEPRKIYFSDCSSALLSKDGTVSQKFTEEDLVHPNLYGVQNWMECLKPTLDKILPVRQVPTLLPPEKKESWAKILSGGVGHASESYTAAGDKGTAKEAAPSGPLTKGDMSDLFAGVMKKFETDLKS